MNKVERERERTISTYFKSAFVNQNCNIYGKTLGHSTVLKKYTRLRKATYRLVRSFANKNWDAYVRKKQSNVPSWAQSIVSEICLQKKTCARVQRMLNLHCRFCRNFELWDLSKLIVWWSTQASRSNRSQRTRRGKQAQSVQKLQVTEFKHLE